MDTKKGGNKGRENLGGLTNVQNKAANDSQGRKLAALRKGGRLLIQTRRAVRPQLPKPETKQRKLCRRRAKMEHSTGRLDWGGEV